MQKELEKFLDTLFPDDKNLKEMAKNIIEFTEKAKESFATIRGEEQADAILGNAILELFKDKNKINLPAKEKINYFLQTLQHQNFDVYKMKTGEHAIKRDITDKVVARLVIYKYLVDHFLELQKIIFEISEKEEIRAILQNYWIKWNLLDLNDNKWEKANLLLGEAVEKILELVIDQTLILDTKFRDSMNKISETLRNEVQNIFLEAKMPANSSAALAVGHFIIYYLRTIKNNLRLNRLGLANGGGQK
jgi:hypothetical protein